MLDKFLGNDSNDDLMAAKTARVKQYSKPKLRLKAYTPRGYARTLQETLAAGSAEIQEGA